MSTKDSVQAPPDTLPSSSAEGAATYALAKDLFAVRGSTPQSPGIEVVESFPSERIWICRGPVPELGSSADATEVLPVYRLQGKGPPAVASGRLFVRFAEGICAQERTLDFSRAGFAVEEIPAYAPNAAWVRATKGGIAASLLGLRNLEVLPDVENIEPQMLMRPARR